MAKYGLKKVGNRYFIKGWRGPVLTPGGKPFSARDERLANLVCEDLCRYGSNPTGSSSYVTLHATYTDFGSKVPKSELMGNILPGYDPGWDIALAQFSAFDALWSSPSFTESPGHKGIVLDPMIYFGPPEETPVIQNWLENLSIRALCSMQVCGATFQSILVGYRILNGTSPVSSSSLAQGIVAYSKDLPLRLVDKGSPQNTVRNIVNFLEKIASYASFPDE